MKKQFVTGTEVEKLQGANYVGEITPEQLELLKRQHGAINVLLVPVKKDLSEFAIGYFKKVDRQVMSAYLSQTDPVVSKEILIEACMIGGDERIKTDDDIFFSACLLIEQMVTFLRGVFVQN